MKTYIFILAFLAISLSALDIKQTVSTRFSPPNSESGGTFCPHSRYVAKIQFKFTIHTNLEVIYFSSSLRPSSLHITYYPSYLILSTSVSFFRLLLKTQESTICNRPTKKIIIKIGTIGT